MTKYTQTKLPRRDVRYVSWCVFASSSANDMVKWLSTRINTWYTYMLWFSTGSLTPKKHLRCTIVFGKKNMLCLTNRHVFPWHFPQKKTWSFKPDLGFSSQQSLNLTSSQGQFWPSQKMSEYGMLPATATVIKSSLVGTLTATCYKGRACQVIK